MTKFTKSILTMSFAALMTATTFAAPFANAQTNVNVSVDDRKEAATTALYTLPAKNSELTIGVTGKYQLQLTDIGLSKDAIEAGFAIVDDNTVSFRIDEDTVKYYDVKWSSNLSKYASVTESGKLSANTVCQKRSTGDYKKVTVSASISDLVFVNADGVQVTFDGGVIAKDYVTVVPEADLSVYFLGVWQETAVDNDAQHNVDYAVTSSNVEDQLKIMAEAATNHCVGTTYNVVAYTKTNNDVVRAYITTNSAKAGNHYYVMSYSTAKKVNKISVTARDFCENSYSYTGTYFRDVK